MGRVCDCGREGVRDGHGAGHDAFDRRREATSWQAHHAWGIPGGQSETHKSEVQLKQPVEICDTRSAMS